LSSFEIKNNSRLEQQQNKIAVIVMQLAICFSLHAYSCMVAAPSCANTNKNFI